MVSSRHKDTFKHGSHGEVSGGRGRQRRRWGKKKKGGIKGGMKGTEKGR